MIVCTWTFYQKRSNVQTVGQVIPINKNHNYYILVRNSIMTKPVLINNKYLLIRMQFGLNDLHLHLFFQPTWHLDQFFDLKKTVVVMCLWYVLHF